jgi:hypothetical protein
MNQYNAQFLLYFVTMTLKFPSHPGLQTLALKEKEVPLPHYTLGLLMMGEK